MDHRYTVTDRLEAIAGHVQLLAELMQTGPDLHDEDHGAFAQVLHELTVRLQEVTEEVRKAHAKVPRREGTLP